MSRRLLAVVVGSLLTGSSLIVAACAPDPERAKREYVKSGDEYAAAGKLSEAIVQYRNAIQQDAKFGEAYLKLGAAYERMGDGQRATAAYVRAADALPQDVSAQLHAARWMLTARRAEEARARAEAAIKLDPKNFDAQLLYGNALAGLGQFKEALEQLDQALTIAPTGSSALFASIGNVQVVQGRLADAEAAFRKAVSLGPKNPATHLTLASFLWSNGRVNEAEQQLQEVLKFDSRNLMARRALAALYVATRRMREAESHLKALADIANDPESRLALADYYVMVNRQGQAFKVLEDLSSPAKPNFAAQTRIAALQIASKEPAAGKALLDQVLARDPKNVAALLVKARTLIAAGQLDEALKYARSAASVDAQSMPAHFVLGTILRAKDQPDEAIVHFSEALKINPRAVAAQTQLAELNLQRGLGNVAVQHAADAARRLPGNLGVQLTLVRSQMASGQQKQAEQTVAWLVKAAPQSPAVHATAGTVALAANRLGEARREYSKAAELDPGSLEAFNGLIMLDLIENKAAAARARADEQLARHPKDPELLYLAARAYLATRGPVRAEELLRQAIEANPAHLRAYGLLGQLYLGQKRLAQARESFESVARQQPDSVAANTAVGILYQMEGNRAEARKRFEEILQRHPDAAVAANNLAFMYAQDGGNLDVALQLAQTAKRRLPDSAEVSDTLGWIYVKKDMATLAIPHLEQAVAKAPRSANSYYHLGVAFTRAGEPAKGRRALEHALTLKLDPATSAEARKLLESM